MTNRNAITLDQNENSKALAELTKAVNQASYLCILMTQNSDDSLLSTEYEPESDTFNNYELAADLMTSAYNATDKITGQHALTPEYSDLQLFILYMKEYFRLLRGKVGQNDFDRCAIASLAELLALDLESKVQRFIAQSGAYQEAA